MGLKSRFNKLIVINVHPAQGAGLSLVYYILETIDLLRDSRFELIKNNVKIYFKIYTI